MTTHLYVQTGAASGGTGTKTAPLQTVQQALALKDGFTRIFVDTSTNNLPHFGTVTLNNISNLEILPWPNRGPAKFRQVALIEFPNVHDATGTYDILVTTEATYTTDPLELIQDPEVQNADGLYAQTLGSGFMPAATGADFAAKITRMKSNVGEWARDGNKLYISVPKGYRNADHTWYRAIAGMLFELTGTCSNILLDVDAAYACETTTTQRGNLLDVAGNINGLTVRGSWQVAYYHNIVTRGNSTANVVIDGPLVATARGQNDGMITLYAGTTFGTGNIIRNTDCWGYGWRTTLGAAYKSNNGVIKGFGHHHEGAEVAAGSLLVQGCRFRKDPVVTAAQHLAWSVSAGSCNHAIPTDIGDFDLYPVQLVGNDFEGGVINGATNAGEIACAYRRCKFWGDFSAVTDQTGMSGLGHFTVNAGNFASKTRALLEACELVFKLADAGGGSAGRSCFSIDDSSATEGTSDAKAKIVACTIYNTQTVTPSNAGYLVSNRANADGLTVEQCILDSGYAQVPIGGNEAANAQTWARNWYSSGLSTTMHAAGGVNRTTWASTYDTAGKYTDNPVFEGTLSGRPDTATAAFKSGAASGPQGINLGRVIGEWDGTYGAHQFGAVAQDRFAPRPLSMPFPASRTL